MRPLCIQLNSFTAGLSASACLGKEGGPFSAEVFFVQKLPRLGLVFGHLLDTVLVFLSKYVYWRGAEIQ